MTRDEIYDHLAKVYLGKSQEHKSPEVKEKRQFHSWLYINLLITAIIFGGSFYGLTAFLTKRSTTDFLKSKIIFAIQDGISTLDYDFRNGFPPTKSFALGIPSVDLSKYASLNFAIRAREEGSPGVLKVVFRNQLNEESYFYVQNIDYEWQDINIPLSEFRNISDWSNLIDVSFVLESWNVHKPNGVVLIDEIHFSSQI